MLTDVPAARNAGGSLLLWSGSFPSSQCTRSGGASILSAGCSFDVDGTDSAKEIYVLKSLRVDR